jgi:hypothetical protein
MTFFNVRLGWWMTNPARHEADIARMERRATRESGDLGIAADQIHVQHRTTVPAALASSPSWLAPRRRMPIPSILSDGGHFDNLGLYEMVRRRCARRSCGGDAGCDPKYEFEDLERATRLIRNDLKVDISFPDGLPTEESIKRTKRHFVIAGSTTEFARRQDPLYQAWPRWRRAA